MVAVERTTAEVSRRTLRSTEELDATLGYDDEGVLLAGLSGIVTWLPEEGTIVEQGEAYIEVDGRRRAALLYGDRPAWRTLDEGVSGTDVRQLETALRALGHLKRSVSPDKRFGEATRKAVEAWQDDLDVPSDGRIELGEVAFTPGAVRIADLQVRLGERVAAGTPLATTTSGTRVVELDLEADRQDLLAVGDAVGLELPDGRTTNGIVTEIGSIATADPGGGDATVRVVISLDDPAATGGLDGAPVTVTFTRETREDVLTVPVDALLALQEGGYALEVVDAAGGTRLTGVELGLFADGRVQVSGSVSAGDEVVVPR